MVRRGGATLLIFVVVVSAQVSNFFWAQQGSTFWCIEPYVSDSSISLFYGYDMMYSSSSWIPFQAYDTSFVFFYLNEPACSLGLVFLHDHHDDGDGGKMTIYYDFPPEAYIAVRDGEDQDTFATDHIYWQWLDCCTDGAAFNGFPLDSCYQAQIQITYIDTNDGGGIDHWMLISGNCDEYIELDTSLALFLGVATSAPSFAAEPESLSIACRTEAGEVTVRNDWCYELGLSVVATEGCSCGVSDFTLPPYADTTLTVYAFDECTLRVFSPFPCVDTVVVPVSCLPCTLAAQFVCPTSCDIATSCSPQEVELVIFDPTGASAPCDTCLWGRVFVDISLYDLASLVDSTFYVGDTLHVLFWISASSRIVFMLDSVANTAGCVVRF